MHHVRQAKLEDAEAIAKIHASCWQECYGFMPARILNARTFEFRVQQWRKTLGQSDGCSQYLAVLQYDADVVGFAVMKNNCDPAISDVSHELHAMYIQPGHRGGVGWAHLLLQLFNDAGISGDDRFSVWVFCENPMRRAYLLFGMSIQVRRNREIAGGYVPELGLISPTVSMLSRRATKLIKRASETPGGEIQNRRPYRCRQFQIF